MNQDRIETGPGGVSFVGPDAVDLYRVTVLKQSISLHQKTGMIPTRGMTITRLLAIATGYTGKRYAGKTKHAAALADLEQHIAAAQASMPIERAR